MTPPIAGLCRVRNEGLIIHQTLDHYARYCSAGIYVLDEASTDNTVEIATAHSAVRGVITLRDFEENPTQRRRFEGWPRQMLLQLAEAQIDDPNLWVIYFDADERMEWDVDSFDFDHWLAASFRLWDCAITPDDEDYPAEMMERRKWFGPEYREIRMAFRARSVMKFIDREPVLNIPPGGPRIHPHAGDVRHYGKAISVEEFEATCAYYSEHQPEPFRSKWLARKGKAVKRDGVSDFGGELMRWEDREEKGYPLVDPGTVV